MKRCFFHLTYLLLAAVLISLLAVAAACKTAATSTTPAVTPQPATTAANPSTNRPSGTFTRTPTAPANPSATAAPSQIPATTPVPNASPSASTPLSPPAGAKPATSPSASAQPATPTATSASATVFPIVSITSPYYMSTNPAGDIIVNIVISNFKVADKVGQAAAPGEGHIVYYLDSTPLTTAGQPAVPATGLFADSIASTYTWHNVTTGMHSLSVQLVNNDDTPLSPPVTSTENIIVQ
jgi:hypothetical protein